MSSSSIPIWLKEALEFPISRHSAAGISQAANSTSGPSLERMAALLSANPDQHLETMAVRARQLTEKHFGKTISLYAPLYLSNYCTGGCAYCGFASDRKQKRRRLEEDELIRECCALHDQHFDDILLLTGEETEQADFNYLRDCVRICSGRFHSISVESFAMSRDQYAALAESGCTGVTLYQESYDPAVYEAMHRWGPKKDFAARLQAPLSAAEGGIRFIGIGALLGLGDPVREALCMLNHAIFLRKTCWKSGIMISFPRLRNETGNFVPPRPVNDKQLAQIIFAFRICLPDVPLVLSTREQPAFRDGMAGIGISRMSVASRTTVGGYATPASDSGQFEVSDNRNVSEFCSMLEQKQLQPVFKNWDKTLR